MGGGHNWKCLLYQDWQSFLTKLSIQLKRKKHTLVTNESIGSTTSLVTAIMNSSQVAFRLFSSSCEKNVLLLEHKEWEQNGFYKIWIFCYLLSFLFFVPLYWSHIQFSLQQKRENSVWWFLYLNSNSPTRKSEITHSTIGPGQSEKLNRENQLKEKRQSIIKRKQLRWSCQYHANIKLLCKLNA